MATDNFSNGGRDTHNPSKHYIGIRLQQGVPLLDRDWNELEDIRRYYERMLRAHYIGEGVPDIDGFKITPPTNAAANQFVIGAGRCIVNGYDVQNETPILFSQQTGSPSLPAPTQPDVFYVYLSASIVRIDSTMDTDLRNRQDINLETCVRDKLEWTVRAARHPNLPPANSYLLAVITRPVGATVITAAMIDDRRRTFLNLARVVDINRAQQAQISTLDTGMHNLQVELQNIRQQLARLFWDVELTTSRTSAYFGDTVNVTVNVRDGLGQPVRNARLLFSSDWGSIDPASAVTDNNGRTTFEVYGVEADSPPSRSDAAILGRVTQRVRTAEISNTGALQYSQIQFQPEELTLMSNYIPHASLSNISYGISGPVIRIPPAQPLTVTVYAKESNSSIVRGIGCLQVSFGMWIKDWTRTKIWETISRAQVEVRVGDILRGSVKERVFDAATAAKGIPRVMDDIFTQSHVAMRDVIFVDPRGGDEAFLQAGLLGQTIAQESNAIIGSKVEVALTTQLQEFVRDSNVELDQRGAQEAHTAISNVTSQHAAGKSQLSKQLLNAGGRSFRR